MKKLIQIVIIMIVVSLPAHAVSEFAYCKRILVTVDVISVLMIIIESSDTSDIIKRVVAMNSNELISRSTITEITEMAVIYFEGIKIDDNNTTEFKNEMITKYCFKDN